MTEESKLAQGWTLTTLFEVCEKIQDGTHFSPKNQLPKGTYRYITAKNVRPWGMDLSDVTFLTEEDHREIYARCDTRAGDVLLVKDGVNTGDAAINTVDEEISLLSSVCMLRPRSEVLRNQFLRYYLLSPTGARLLTGKMTGTAIRRIILKRIKETPIPLAPFGEQIRIVERVEELLSDLDAGVAALERARANLKKYRAAVLKAAVTGDLTAEWRAKHPNVEPTTKLLDRILAERRRKWEADQQANFAASGKAPPKGWQEKYPEPAVVDSGGLPELPPGWCWATVDQLISYLRNGYFQSPEPLDAGVRLLRINAVRAMRVDLEEFRYLTQSDALSNYFVENGDLLFTRYNGSLDLLGVAGMVRGCAEPTVHPDKLIRVKTVIPAPLAAYLEIACNTGESRRHMVGRARTTAGQTGISGSDVRDMPVPLPPLDEQRAIVAEVEQQLSDIDATANYIAASLKRAARLRQSILKEAFAGRLVPQDPNDEPASVLLDRIRRVRADDNGNAVSRQRRARKNAGSPMESADGSP